MNAELNDRVRLVEETYAYVYRQNVGENVETFKREVKKYIKMINVLVNTDFKKLSDEEFYTLISKAYYISLDEEDYLKIISKRYNKKFNRFVEIGTHMTFTGLTSEGRGRNFDWWRQLYQLRYIVAVAEDFNIKEDANFSKNDISQMIKDKNIVIVKSTTKSLNGKLNFKKEKVKNFPIINLDICEEENFPIVISMLRRKFTKKRVLKDMKEYIIELEKDINDVLHDIIKDYDHEETSRLCNEWFTQSQERQTYTRLLEKLDNDK